MNTTYPQTPITHSITHQATNIASPDTRGVLQVGQQHGWPFIVLGQAPFPKESVRLGDWLVVPAHEDSSSIPSRTYERVQAIFEAGLRPKGFVMVHEAPNLLQPTRQVNSDEIRMSSLHPKHKAILKIAGYTLATLGVMLAVITGLAILAFAAIFIAGALLVPAALVATIAVVDPILIAVTDDEYWIEIDRWDS